MSPLLKKTAIVLGIFQLAIQLFLFLPTVLHNPNDRDLFIYQRAATRIHQQEPLYNVALQQNYTPTSPPNRGYIYPPPLAAMLLPFAQVSPRVFIFCWTIILLIAFWGAAAGLSFMTLNRHSLEGIMSWSIVLGAFPSIYFGMALGQIDIVLLALFCVGLVSRKEVICWTTAALVKIFFIWPLMVVLLERTKKLSQIAVGIIPVLLLIGAGGWIAGWHSYVVWLRDILPTLAQGSWVSDNISLSFAALRLLHWLGWWNYAGGKIIGLPQLWLTAASIGAPLLVYYCSRKSDIPFRCACVVAASVFFAPVCWSTYAALLLPVAALTWKSYGNHGESRSLK